MAAAAAHGDPKPRSTWLCPCFAKPAVEEPPTPNGSSSAAAAVAAPHHKAAAPAVDGRVVRARSADSDEDVPPPAADQAGRPAAAAAAPAGAQEATLKAHVAAIRPIKTHAEAGGMADAPGSKAGDQAALPHTPTLAELKHLMASSMDRPYTDKDWYAALKMLDVVIAQQRQRALQQLRLGGAAGGPPLQRTSFASAHSGAEQWHDAVSHTMSDASAVSEAEKAEVAQIAAELELLRGPVSVVRELDCTPSCVPNPPLLFAEPHWKYRQVDCAAFCAYWERDATRSTPFPLPIDAQLKLNSLLRRTHESIPGMWMHMLTPTQMQLVAAPDIIAIPGVVSYHEYFNTDSSLAHWALRRDIRIGRTQGQMFMTTDGILIFRVFTTGMFSKTVEWIGEDYMRLEDNGDTIITRQMCKHIGDNSVEGQYLIGRKRGLTPPPRRSLLHSHSHGGH